MPICLRTIAGAGIILHIAATSAAAIGLCITPVTLVDPANPDTPELISNARSFPGSAWPVFYASGRLEAWMLDEHGKLRRPTEFPTDLINDKFVAEPTGRVVGTKRYGHQIYVQDPANGRFVSLNGTEKEAIGMVSMASWITNWNATLVATSMGLFALTNDVPIPALKRVEVEPGPVGPLAYIFDLPRNHAAALVTGDGRLLILDAMNRVHDVPGVQIKKGQWLLRVSEIENSNRLLVEGSHQTWTVSMRQQADASLPNQAREITTLKHDGSGILQYYKAVGQYLVYGTPDRWLSLGGPAILRLDDDLVSVEGSRGLSDYPSIHDIPSRGLVVVQTFKRLYKYDGKGPLEPIAGSLASEIGDFPQVHDITSQHRVLAITSSGLYELTLEGKLVRIPPPPELEGAKFHQLAEMPASQIAVVFTNRGIFAVDQTGTFSHVTGDDHIDLGAVGPSLVTRIPARETLFFSTYGNAGQFMIVDTGKNPQGACAAIQ